MTRTPRTSPPFHIDGHGPVYDLATIDPSALDTLRSIGPDPERNRYNDLPRFGAHSGVTLRAWLNERGAVLPVVPTTTAPEVPRAD